MSPCREDQLVIIEKQDSYFQPGTAIGLVPGQTRLAT